MEAAAADGRNRLRRGPRYVAVEAARNLYIQAPLEVVVGRYTAGHRVLAAQGCVRAVEGKELLGAKRITA